MSENSTETGGQLPRSRPGELLEEPQLRVDTVRGTRDRVHSLLEAVLSVGRELDLPHVLRRIVETAVVLVDAEYGALGVIGDDAQLSEFLTVGVSDEQALRIGPLPSGHGILGELIRHPETLRLPELSAHPASYGLPENHPPMRTFLGVPIRVRDMAFGNIYLTEKRGGREFDAEDESLLTTLAVAAGIAIENARLYKKARESRRWMEANAEVVSELLSGADETPVLELIVDHGRRILHADLGVVALPVPGGTDLQVMIAMGVDAENHRGLVLPGEGSFMGTAMSVGRPITTTHITTDPRVTVGPPRWQGLGPVVAVPMVAGEKARGVLMLARKEGSAEFTEGEASPLLSFAGHAALALELAERRRGAEQLALLEDRDRIARDLHDLAIQRLFATGMTLQSAARFVQHPEASERLARAVDDLDETIKIIRSTIFGLRVHESGRASQSLRVRVSAAVAQAARTLGFTPALSMEGLIDTDVPSAVADDAIAVLAETLSNVSRHARATTAGVSFAVRSGTLTITVVDNGVGVAAGSRRSGLDNLAVRAERHDGTMDIRTGTQGGARLVWCVPVAADHAGPA
ncbi:histidine kinase [Streptomyces sp. AcH 505]|uniref:GAF domain-containing sensor histidine kinase n=1 Tax=Streptomyces sp. AcH 505 TaxID=352211 RepID=UPI000591FEAE|nr:histidine kinase [Streptomyces sp. AcH 505]